MDLGAQMSSYVSFDELDSLTTSASKKPFFAVNLESEDAVLTWLKEELVSLRNQNQTRLEKIKNNLLRYRGYQYLNTVYYPRDVLETQRKYTPQMVLPLLSDACDEKVSRLMEFKPNIVVVPVHDETSDKHDAKTAKRFLSHIDYVQKLDTKFRQILTSSKIAGESFAWTRWNPDLGEILGEVNIARKALEAGGDDNKNPQEQIRQGDVEVVKKTSHWVFYERAESWDKVNYCYVIELDYVEALKLDYPDKAGDIYEESDAKVFDYDKMEEISIQGRCRKIHFYHKKTKYLPQGYEACFTMGALLKKGPLSYAHGDLPIDRLVDIENDEELAGQSFFDKVKSISSQINNSLNMVVKMMMLAGMAKWFVEGGSVDDQSLNNDINIVKIKQGARPPVLAQANPVGPGHYQFIEKLQEWFYQFAKSNSVIRGEPPPGVTAGVALQYVSESESRRMTTEVQQLNQFVRSVYDKVLKTCAQFYKPDEERTMMLMGKDNKWENFPLDTKTLTKPYSIMIQNTSGLSDSKAVRTQQVMDLNEQFPGLFPREQVIEMVGLAQGDKFLDTGSSAARCAEDENEWIQDGKGQIEPAEWEDSITHWKIHTMSMQSLGFKTKAPPETIQAMVDHLTATEMLMMDQAAKNPAYQQALMTLQGFPMFFAMPLPPPLPPEALPPEVAQAPQEMPQPEAMPEMPMEQMPPEMI
jgi:hypothetical protein